MGHGYIQRALGANPAQTLLWIFPVNGKNLEKTEKAKFFSHLSKSQNNANADALIAIFTHD
jgi:hypothetical protein